jgi:hypothetical protein
MKRLVKKAQALVERLYEANGRDILLWLDVYVAVAGIKREADRLTPGKKGEPELVRLSRLFGNRIDGAYQQGNPEECKWWLVQAGVALRELDRITAGIGYPEGRPRKVTPEMLKRVREWRHRMTQAEIAKRLGLSRQTVNRIIREVEIVKVLRGAPAAKPTPRPEPETKEDKLVRIGKAIKSLKGVKGDGVTPEDIAWHVGQQNYYDPKKETPEKRQKLIALAQEYLDGRAPEEYLDDRA